MFNTAAWPFTVIQYTTTAGVGPGVGPDAGAGANTAAIPTSFFAYDVLKAGTPEGVDLSRKEVYLEDAAFAELFDCSKVEFAAQPKWQQKSKKKKLGLF